MSNDPKKQQPSSVLSAIKEKVERPEATMDNRALTKSALATAMFKAAIESYGLVGMFKRKKEISANLIQDLKDGFQMIDEIYDKASE